MTSESPAGAAGAVLVTGATGRVGGAVARELAVRGARVRALVRDPSRCRDLEAAGVATVAGDLERAGTLAAALAGIDAALLCTADGPGQPELERTFVDAAAAAGVRRVVKVSAQSAGAEPPVSFGHYHRISERHLQASPVSWTIVRPTLFMQSLLLFAPAVRRGRLVAPVGDGKVAFVDLRDAAAVAAEALTGDAYEGEILEATGPQAFSFAEVAEQLATATGRRVRHVSPPAPVARVMLRLAGGMSAWEARQVVELMTALRAGLQSATADTVQRVTGAPPRTLAAFCAEHVQAFSPEQPSRR